LGVPHSLWPPNPDKKVRDCGGAVVEDCGGAVVGAVVVCRLVTGLKMTNPACNIYKNANKFAPEYIFFLNTSSKYFI
jgi:hypothetical protein